MKIENYYKKFKLLIVLLFLFFPFSFFFCVPSTHAQTVNLSITPPLIELMIKPGKSILVAYTVVNQGDPVILSPQVSSFVPQGQTGNIRLVNELLGPVRFNLENADITLAKSVFLKTGDKQQFLLKMRVPDNAPEGDYYYTFFVKADPGPLFTGQNVSKSTATVGSNILVTVSATGRVEAKGAIAHFDLEDSAKFKLFGRKYNIIESTSVLPIKMIVQNNGSNLIKPDGEIILRGPLGVLSRHKITPVNILTQSSRLVPATPSAQVKTPSSFALKGFFIGEHKLGTTITFGPGSSPVYASASFIAIPIKLISVLVVSLAVTFAIIVRMRARQKES